MQAPNDQTLATNEPNELQQAQGQIYFCITTGDLGQLRVVLETISSIIPSKSYLDFIYFAVDQDRVTIVQELLNYVNDRNQQLIITYKTCEYAILKLKFRIFTAVFNPSIGLQSISTKNGHNLFHLATVRGNTDFVEYMAQYFNINTQDVSGNSALHFATKLGKLKMIEVLVKLGAFTEFQNNDSDTPLMFALNTGRKDAAFKLIELGADLNLVNKYKENALHIFARVRLRYNWNSDEFIDACQKNPTFQTIDTPNYCGESLLFVAADNLDVALILTLIRAGANTQNKNEIGETIGDVAREFSWHQVTNLLTQKSIFSNSIRVDTGNHVVFDQRDPFTEFNSHRYQ